MASAAALAALLKAPSKEIVEQVFLQAFLNARGRAGKRPEQYVADVRPWAGSGAAGR